ncbi:MAG: 2-phosphosulfolactate phosphatase [Breznakibacter sp.]
MEIDLMPSANAIDPKKLQGATAVVIDVLRATSVMVTAFANGLGKLITVSSPEEAFSLRDSNPSYLLGGERDAVYVPGFDLDNSPFNYTTQRIGGKTLVMSTSNGTRAINGSLNAHKLVIGSFLNATAVAKQVRNDEKVVLVCSGSNNTFTLEDSLCAGYIAWLLKNTIPQTKLSDFVTSMVNLYFAYKDDLKPLAAQGNHYQLLKGKGFEADLDYCFSPDRFDLVPVWKNGIISLQSNFTVKS